ncbi:hypothetical protein [Acinetobacter pittii]|uniref:hypothetical protein n=1 Tax=Acinetobacter pittii TaxID=48296 RepID=UPI0039F4A59C
MPTFLNHLYDEQPGYRATMPTDDFLNHLYDEQRMAVGGTVLAAFLNHLYDEQLELSKNKTLKKNNIKF